MSPHGGIGEELLDGVEGGVEAGPLDEKLGHGVTAARVYTPLQHLFRHLKAGFNLSIAKKYRRSPINGFIGFIKKFLGQK
jgi:hypothetical protein